MQVINVIAVLSLAITLFVSFNCASAGNFAATVANSSNKLNSSAQENSPWKTWRKTAYIQINQRSVHASNLIEIKATISLNTTAQNFLLFLNNIQQHSLWFDRVKQSKQVLNSQGETILLYEFNKLLFSKKRQMAVKYETQQQSPTSVLITIEDQSKQLALSLLFSDAIVMQVHQAHWKITEKTFNNIPSTLVTYQFIIDPKGSTPAWLANKFLLKSTLRTLQNIHNEFPH